MAQTSPIRKSGRQRVPNKKYSIDDSASLDVFSSDSERGLETLQQLQDSKNDNDFQDDHGEENVDEDSPADGISDASTILTPGERHEDVHTYASSDPEEHDPAAITKYHKRKAKVYASDQDANVRFRGMPENMMRSDHESSRLKLYSGSDVKDILHVIRSRDQWAADPTLPSRKRMRHQISHTEEKRQMEATVGWDWYYDQGGREYFGRKQKVRGLSSEEGLAYVSQAANSSLSFLMGPYGRQKVFTLAASQSLALAETWYTSFESSEQNMEGSKDCKQRRLGWMLNVGTRIRCLDWAPNHHGATQYLALAVANASASIRATTLIEAPAFTPSCPAPSSIQIWAFDASEKSKDSTPPPELQLVFCTEWGEIAQLKWCPVPRARRNEDALGKISVGLLAGVWGDGCARVLDVQLEKGQGAITSYLKVQTAAFAAIPRLLPHADIEQREIRPVATCLTWLSATDIAIGYSNGTLRIYNIYPHSRHSSLPTSSLNESTAHGVNSPTSPRAEAVKVSEAANGSNDDIPTLSLESPIGYDVVEAADANIRPWLFLQLHPTYILSLTSAYPTHPALLISSSLSGNLRLTSLGAPTTDYILSARTRTPPSSLAYCDSLLAVVAPEEASETLRLWGLRCFYSSLACGKLGSVPGPGQGIVDVGSCHSSVAAGGANGSVTITNPMRKVLGRKAKGWQQVAFKHEWVRRPGQGPRQGISRITEGYEGEKVDLGVKYRGQSKESVNESTIHEEETAVTALKWNPNGSGRGGWLAVGWGSGLVRVQDMAV